MAVSRFGIASASCFAALVATVAFSASLVIASNGYAESEEPDTFASVADFDASREIAAARVSAVAGSVAESAPIQDAISLLGQMREQAAAERAYYEQQYWYAPSDADAGSLRYDGVQTDGEHTYTWYSQNVLPGGGLDIPGRHVGDGGYIMDGDGNIAVASSDYEYGTVVETPYGTAKVYDSGCASGVIDVYTNW